MEQERTAYETPFGTLTATWSRRGVSSLSFRGGRRRGGARRSDRADGLGAALERYFGTGTWSFAVPLDLRSGTDFDRDVWKALRRIPAGQVRTYGQIARAIGKPNAARAVGNACGRNPIPIVVPCHRVVSSRGIGGFGLGLSLKRKLLALEGIHV